MRFWMVVVAVFGCWTFCGSAAVLLDAATTGTNVVPTATFLRDAGGSLMWEEVARPEYHSRFQSVAGNAANFGFTHDAVWMRFQVRSKVDRPSNWLLVWETTLIEELDVWVVRTNSVVDHEVAGLLQASSPGRCHTRFPAIRLPLEASEAVTVLVRMRTQSALDVPLWLYEPVTFAERTARWELLNLLAFGGLAVLLVLAVTFGWVTRIPGYFLYAASIAGDSIVCWISSGYWQWLHWPGHVFWSTQGFLLAMEMVTITLLLYLRAFFDLRHRTPRYDCVVLTLVAMAMLLMPLSQMGSFQVWIRAVLVQVMVMGMISLGTAAYFVWRGDRTAKFYLISWIQFWILWFVENLHYQGLLTLPFPPQHLGLMGLVIGYTCFFISMADRMRQMRMEREAARDRYFLSLEHITRDLHDGVGGMMAHIGATAALRNNEDEPRNWKGLLEEVENLAIEASSEIRSLMNTLESHEMYWANWLRDLALFAERSTKPFGIQLDWERTGTAPALMPSLQGGLSLMSAAKEAINNAIRHARASTLRVALDFQADGVCVEIADNGSGLGSSIRKGRGLDNMRRRVEELGGVMEIDQSKGTTVRFRIPFAKWKEQAGTEGKASL